VRTLDRFFDNYVMTPQGKFVFDALRPAEGRDPYGVEDARKMLDTSYAWLDRRMQGRTWAVGQTFTLADCAAAPSCSTRTGRTGFPSITRVSWPTARVCCNGRPSPER
jgi:glutathione S-transferase